MISVIIPVHNAERFLTRCVESVLHSTYSDLEIILIENGSTDRSLELCQQYELKYDNVLFLVSDKIGASRARNIGLDHAKGEYIAFVDADDYVSPTMYDVLIKCLNINQADLVFCDFYQGTDSNFHFQVQEGKVPHCSKVSIQEFYYDLFMKERCSHFAPWNKLIKREILEEIRFDETLRIAEDKSFIARSIGECKRIYKVQESLYYYYRNSESLCGRSNKDSDIWMDMVRALIKDKRFMETKFPDRQLFKVYVTCCMLRACDFHLKWAEREKNSTRIEELNCIITKSLLEVYKSEDLELKLKIRVILEHYFPGFIQKLYKIYKQAKGICDMQG